MRMSIRRGGLAMALVLASASVVAVDDEVHAEILQMADMLSDGIIAQFPHAFVS